eukprot:1315054-Pyramimonas_sp.AAC.1
MSHMLRSMRKSSSDALDNLNKADQQKRKWVSNSQIRLREALAGCTFVNSKQGTVPSWRPDSATAQPLA